MAEKLIGQNYTPPDHVAKVTGRARYAEDFRADGMLFTKLLLSPMPHARVRSIDASAALAMPGVVAILTADEVSLSPPPPGPPPWRSRSSSAAAEPAAGSGADQRAGLPGRAHSRRRGRGRADGGRS